MTFEYTAAEIRSVIPNTIAAGRGENTIADKVNAFVPVALTFLGLNVISPQAIEPVADELFNPDDKETLQLAIRQIVLCDAICSAIPGLDLVLSPTGFGVVNTDSVAPASTQRVKELTETTMQRRDTFVALAVKKLMQSSSWKESKQAAIHTGSLFSIEELCNITLHSISFEEFKRQAPVFAHYEKMLAESYFSEALLRKFRRREHSGTYAEASVIHTWQRCAYMLAQGANIRQPDIIDPIYDAIQLIKESPDLFPEWHSSRQAKLFTPPVFTNRKSSSGYFF